MMEKNENTAENKNMTLEDLKEYAHILSDATESTSSKHMRITKWLVIALILTNAFWAAVLGYVTYQSYKDIPVETTVEQDLQTQKQTYKNAEGDAALNAAENNGQVSNQKDQK